MGWGKGSGNKQNHLPTVVAPAAVAVMSTQRDDSKPNQQMIEQRKQVYKQSHFWYEPTINTISSSKGAVNFLPRSEWDTKTSNVVYGIYNAKTGNLEYIGKTEQKLSDRIQAHVRDIKAAKKNTDLVKFFNSDGQTVEDMRVVVLHKVKPEENIVRKEMELVLKYDTKNNGANMRYPINLKRYNQD